MAVADATPLRISLSYRRDDTAGYARAIADELGRHFGADQVFIDVDDIGAGSPFGEVIERAIGESQVLLVLIGKRWRGEREAGPARLVDPGDLVRREVAGALARGMRVIPLLFDGVAMPSAAELPDDLRALAGRNALPIDNARFAADFARLVTALGGTIDEPVAPAPRRPLWLGLGAAALGLAIAIAVALLWPRAPASPQSAGRPTVNGAWQAEVDYDWPNAHYVERFDFTGDGADLRGTASFLGVARGVLEGRVEAPGRLHFVTRTTEDDGATRADSVHRYDGAWAGDQIRFVMQTEGGLSDHRPVEFVAHRVPRPAP